MNQATAVKNAGVSPAFPNLTIFDDWNLIDDDSEGFDINLLG